MYTVNVNIMIFNHIVMLNLLVLITTAIEIPAESDLKKIVQDQNPVKNDVNEKSVSLDIKTKVNSANTNTTKLNKDAPSNNTLHLPQSHIDVINTPSIADPSALYRLFYVLLGLCTIIVIYVSYSFYKTRKGTTRLTTIRKYGVLTQKTDIEMLPLPIDEDEEDDDTVFDVGNHVNR